jgi:Leucine-rich repeat (LRR) protein
MSDSLALVDLYNATGGGNWTYAATSYFNSTTHVPIPNVGTAWNFTQPMDTWHGVQLNGSGCVAILALNSNNLLGNLIDINLPNLTGLYLYYNQLSGSIPDFTNLSNLEFLQLDLNQLTF